MKKFEGILVRDDRLTHWNRGKAPNSETSLWYRDERGREHIIVMEECARNGEALGLGKNLIGERDIDSCSLVFFTSGAHTKVVFPKGRVRNFFGNKCLVGRREARFRELSEGLEQAGWRFLESRGTRPEDPDIKRNRPEDSDSKRD